MPSVLNNLSRVLKINGNTKWNIGIVNKKNNKNKNLVNWFFCLFKTLNGSLDKITPITKKTPPCSVILSIFKLFFFQH